MLTQSRKVAKDCLCALAPLREEFSQEEKTLVNSRAETDE